MSLNVLGVFTIEMDNPVSALHWSCGQPVWTPSSFLARSTFLYLQYFTRGILPASSHAWLVHLQILLVFPGSQTLWSPQSPSFSTYSALFTPCLTIFIHALFLLIEPMFQRGCPCLIHPWVSSSTYQGPLRAIMLNKYWLNGWLDEKRLIYRVEKNIQTEETTAAP